MATRTPSASSLARTAATFLAAQALLVSACRQVAPPSLAAALAAQGPPAARARACLRVALEGSPAERRRAAFVWGLLACDADAPSSALTAFRLANPRGGRAVVAARRLSAALARTRAPGQVWLAAAEAPWLAEREREELLLAGGEALLEAGRVDEAARCGRRAAEVRRGGRTLLLLARVGDRAALKELALEAPALAAGNSDLPPLATVTATFTPTEWQRHAAAWLAAGNPTQALAAARRGGAAAAAEGARAALQLRRPQEALGWVGRLSEGRVERYLLEAEARRQLAWGAAGGDRARHFEASVALARRAQVLARDAAEVGAAALLAAEGLVETGHLAAAAAELRREEARLQGRFEWVWRRWVFLRSLRGGVTGDSELEQAGRTTRGRRLARYLTAVGSDGSVRDAAALRELVGSGFVDLPALWAAERLGEAVPPLSFAAQTPQPAPPLWSKDLLAAGRLADVLVGWRADLEAGRVAPRGWLGFAATARLAPLEAIPLLVRGEPRLLSGQWDGLPRPLLEAYLPLLWRGELEQAATRAGVPPWLLAGLVRQESAWSARAVSPAGAVGLAQVLPATAREVMRRRPDIFSGAADITAPLTNLTVGGVLLADWRRAFGGSWVVALAAYNAGQRRVQAVWERAGRRDGAVFVEALEIPETWDYVHRVVMLAEGYRALYWPAGRGFPWT